MSLGALCSPLLAARPQGCVSAPRGVAAAGHCGCLGGRCSCTGRTAQLRSAFLVDARQRASAPQCRSTVLSVSAQAAPAAPPLRSVLNQRGAPLTPPSGGPAPPVWHAIIEVGGAQQIVQEGRFYSCHSLPDVQAGQKVVFERVLATKQPGGGLAVGKPYVAGAKVHATVLENFKDKKIIVFKMKAKKHYRRKAGHRQHMTRFLITKVEFGAAK